MALNAQSLSQVITFKCTHLGGCQQQKPNTEINQLKMQICVLGKTIFENL